MLSLLIGDLGTPELLIVWRSSSCSSAPPSSRSSLAGSGRALRIFKAETKGLTDDDRTTTHQTTASQRRARGTPGRRA